MALSLIIGAISLSPNSSRWAALLETNSANYSERLIQLLRHDARLKIADAGRDGKCRAVVEKHRYPINHVLSVAPAFKKLSRALHLDRSNCRNRTV